jgi:hypothetical protein
MILIERSLRLSCRIRKLMVDGQSRNIGRSSAEYKPRLENWRNMQSAPSNVGDCWNGEI